MGLLHPTLRNSESLTERDEARRYRVPAMHDSADIREAENDPIASLRAFHAAVDRDAAALAGRHGARIRCTLGCAGCCRDDLTVFAVEAARIRTAHVALLERGSARPPGACAFLDDANACRIYADRPYVCRTQGLPLRLFESRSDGAVVERRDVCPLNEPGGPPIETLSDDDCWLIGPNEARLRGIAAAFDPDLGRVPLRALFGASRAGDDYV